VAGVVRYFSGFHRSQASDKHGGVAQKSFGKACIFAEAVGHKAQSLVSLSHASEIMTTTRELRPRPNSSRTVAVLCPTSLLTLQETSTFGKAEGLSAPLYQLLPLHATKACQAVTRHPRGRLNRRRIVVRRLGFSRCNAYTIEDLKSVSLGVPPMRGQLACVSTITLQVFVRSRSQSSAQILLFDMLFPASLQIQFLTPRCIGKLADWQVASALLHMLIVSRRLCWPR
jgi:hypothetical protein